MSNPTLSQKLKANRQIPRKDGAPASPDTITYSYLAVHIDINFAYSLHSFLQKNL
jgi:hypothetical protein